MARNYNPNASFAGYRSRKSRAEGAAFGNLLLRWGRFWGRWIAFIFFVVAIPDWVGSQYSCKSEACGGGGIPDAYMGTLLTVLVVVMIVNTLRYRWDRNKHGQHVDMVNRRARAALSLFASTLIIIQTVRYLEGFTFVAGVITVFVVCDYLIINWTRFTETEKQKAKGDLHDYNYVPHAERQNR